MNFFKKKKPLPDVAGIAPEAGEASASEAVENPTPSSDPNPAPAYSAETMLGGLGWYRTQYQRAMKLALVLVLALCVSAAVNVLLIVKQPTPRYFAATPDLRLGQAPADATGPFELGDGNHLQRRFAGFYGMAGKTLQHQREF